MATIRALAVKRRRLSGWMIAASGLLMSGCAALPGDQTAGTAAGRIEFSETGRGEPPVVFEAGTGNYKEIWNTVFPVIAAQNLVFAYDRPGIGRSDGTSEARDGMTIIEDLRTILRGRELRPPYVLVGYSAGGLYMQLYARRYPAEVAGLVLVDPTHPAQFEGEGAMSQRSAWVNLVVDAALSGAQKAEFDALDATGRQVLASPPLPPGLPVVIIVAPEKSGSRLAAFDNAKRADFARLYPSAEIRVVGGGHGVPQSDPQAVIAAIRDVLARCARHGLASQR
jgi:pimeloyl-ACP methyl ester carboxylesterase